MMIRGKRSLIYDLGILTLAQVFTMALSVVALVFIARKIGPHWFGVVQLGVAFSAYALVIAEWGMLTLGIREVARLEGPRQVHSFASSHLGLMLAMALVVCGLGVLVLPLFPFYKADAWVFLIYLVVVLPNAATLDWVGIGLERMNAVGAAKVGRSALYAALVLLLLSRDEGWLGWPAHRWVPVILLVAFCGSALYLALRARRWLGVLVRPAYAGWPAWRQRLGAAAPIGAGLLTMRILLNVDIIILGWLATPSLVGSYAAAAKIIFVLLIAVEVLWRAALPRLSRLWRESPAQFRSRYTLYLGVALVLLLPVAMGGFLVGDRLMAIVYRGSFPEAGEVFRILSISYVVLALGQFFGFGLIASDRQRWFFLPLLASAAVAVVAMFTLIPRWGGAGAAYGMLIAHSILFLITGWLGRGLLQRSLLVPLLMAMVGVAIMVLFVIAASGWPIVALILAAGCVYALPVSPFLLRWVRRQSASISNE